MSAQPLDQQSAQHSSCQPWREPLGALVPLSHVDPERVTWLSPDRLAAGKLTVLDGDPGLEKPTLLIPSCRTRSQKPSPIAMGEGEGGEGFKGEG